MTTPWTPTEALTLALTAAALTASAWSLGRINRHRKQEGRE